MAPASPSSPLRSTLTWLILVAATGLSWWLAEGHTAPARAASYAVIAIATFKARLIVLGFMEVRSAPWRWRLVVEGWVFVALAGIALGYAFLPTP